jgi:hypothetical protein
MARRPAGVQTFTRNAAGLVDAVIKDAPGKLYSVNLSWTGATADDLIHINDCATVAAITDANRIFTFRVPAATGTFGAVLPAVGKEALVGLVFNLQASGIKLAVDVGFD